MLRILVVDDNADMAASVVTMLTLHDYSAFSMSDVAAALDAMDNDPSISMVISDVRMPSLDGLDFFRVLRHRYPSLPVVLMTGMPISDDDVVPRGATVLQKPFEFEQLHDVIKSSLGQDQ